MVEGGQGDDLVVVLVVVAVGVLVAMVVVFVVVVGVEVVLVMSGNAMRGKAVVENLFFTSCDLIVKNVVRM